VLHEPLDRAALAGSIASFEQNHHALTSILDPYLQLEQFDLQPELLLFIALSRQQILVGISAFTPAGTQLRIGIYTGGTGFIAFEKRTSQGPDLIRGCSFNQGFELPENFRVWLQTFRTPRQQARQHQLLNCVGAAGAAGNPVGLCSVRTQVSQGIAGLDQSRLLARTTLAGRHCGTGSFSGRRTGSGWLGHM